MMHVFNYPFLTIAVFYHSIHVIPISPQPKESQWHESILSHDHKVGEETGQHLDHSYLSISDADEAFINQSVVLWISGLSHHDLTLSLFISKGNSWNLKINIRRIIFCVTFIWTSIKVAISSIVI